MTPRDFRGAGASQAAARTEQLLHAWKHQAVVEQEAGVNDAEQIRALRAALGAVRVGRSKRTGAWVAIGAAVAVAAALALFVLPGHWRFDGSAESRAGAHLASGGLLLQGDDGGRAEKGQPLEAGSSFETGGTRAVVAFASGSQAEVAPHSAGRLVAVGAERREELFLRRGVVEVQVPRLASPVEFSVATPRARVVVHGTRFRVEVAPEADGGGTRVAVTRGVVSVHVAGQPERRLTAGQSWQEEPVEVPPDAPEPEASQPEPAEAQAASGKDKPAPKVSSRQAARRRRSATLRRENALFARAMRSKRAGKLMKAVQQLGALQRKYPRSVLCQEAQIEQFRLLREAGEIDRAQAVATRYLRRYPAGYARQEALALTEGTDP